MGGGAPMVIQSMCNTKTWDVEKTVQQIKDFRAAGCDIVRIAIPDMRAAEAVPAIKEQVDMPLVADIHFDHRLALLAAQGGAKKIAKELAGFIANYDKLDAAGKEFVTKYDALKKAETMLIVEYVIAAVLVVGAAAVIIVTVRKKKVKAE